VAEHSFRALLLMQFSAHTRIAKNKQAINRAIILFTQRSVLMALIRLLLQDILEKVTMQRTQQFSAFSLLPEELS